MSTAQTIKTVGLFSVLGIIALAAIVLQFLSRGLDPLFARALRRGLIFGLILTGVQVVGFMLARG